MNKGKLIIIVAPSGTGKTSLIERLKKEVPLQWSVSCTTRSMRQGEVHGKDYFYISVPEFEKKISEKAFLEWAKVHSNYYGTLKSFVDEGLEKGDFLLFDLDVQGCDSFKKIYGDDAKVIYIVPPSVEELEKRLRKRATDKDHVIEERIKNAKEELKRQDDYDFKVINDDINVAYNDLKNVINSIITGKAGSK